jgi:hypothetical protein
MTSKRYGLPIAAAILITAAVSGCSHSSSHPAAASKSAAAGQPQTGTARTSILMVLDDYERDGAAAKTGVAKKDYGDNMSQYYADASAMTAIHGSGGIGAPLGCKKASGTTVIDGAIVGTPTVAAGSITIPVSLFTGTTAAAQLTVKANAAGKLTGLSCGPAATVDLPGAATLVGYYGGVAALATDPNADDKTTALKAQYLAPAFAKFTRPEVKADQSECAEDTMAYWHAVYDPTATSTGAQWYFGAGGGGQVNMSVAVDPAASHVAWVYCFGQLTTPMGPGSYSDSQVQSYVSDLFNDYAYLQALKPFGADTSGMKTYFASDTAYQTAIANTGAQPLECSTTAAVSMGADSVTVTGNTAVVSLSSSPLGHSVDPGQALGHPKVTVDMSTMKFTGVTCG